MTGKAAGGGLVLRLKSVTRDGDPVFNRGQNPFDGVLTMIFFPAGPSHHKTTATEKPSARDPGGIQ